MDANPSILLFGVVGDSGGRQAKDDGIFGLLAIAFRESAAIFLAVVPDRHRENEIIQRTLDFLYRPIQDYRPVRRLTPVNAERGYWISA